MESESDWTDYEIQALADRYDAPPEFVRDVIAQVGASRMIVEAQVKARMPTFRPISARLRAAKPQT